MNLELCMKVLIELFQELNSMQNYFPAVRIIRRL